MSNQKQIRIHLNLLELQEVARMNPANNKPWSTKVNRFIESEIRRREGLAATGGNIDKWRERRLYLSMNDMKDLGSQAHERSKELAHQYSRMGKVHNQAVLNAKEAGTYQLQVDQLRDMCIEACEVGKSSDYLHSVGAKATRVWMDAFCRS